ncbi:METTL5 family protein [Halorussus litoreus]
MATSPARPWSTSAPEPGCSRSVRPVGIPRACWRSTATRTRWRRLARTSARSRTPASVSAGGGGGAAGGGPPAGSAATTPRSAAAAEDSTAATAVDWLLADATRAPVCTRPSETTVLMNPPFGAQSGNEHADRAFLATAGEVAAVSYSIHNAGSEAFVESFAHDEGGAVTHAFRAAFDLPRRFDHQTSQRETVDAEVFRIEWDGE